MTADRICPECHAINQPITTEGECFNCIVQRLPDPWWSSGISFGLWIIIGVVIWLMMK